MPSMRVSVAKGLLRIWEEILKAQKGRRLQQIDIKFRHKERERTRTIVYASYVLEGSEQKHEDNAHAKDLDSSPGHIEHESLHRKRFRWSDGVFPCPFFLELVIGGR